MINLKQVFSRKILLILFFLIFTIFFFNQKFAETYFSYKFSKWVEKDILIKNFKINYPHEIIIHDLIIFNDKKFHNKSIFEAKIIKLNINLKSFLFEDLVIINNLEIKEPTFYLELLKKKIPKTDNQKKENEIYEDNLGLAEKVNSNLPDKIWPKKNKDINFLIKNSKISSPKAYLKISAIEGVTEVSMSDFEFFEIGNQRGIKHYKDVLEIILFDIFASVKDREVKFLLKEIYNL